MKTISELNSKIWYRLLKVIYVLFFFLVFLYEFLIIYTANIWVLDVANSKVICQYGNEKQFLIREILNKDEVSVYWLYTRHEGDKSSEKILKACNIDKIITHDTQPTGFIPDPYRIEEVYKSDFALMLTYLLLGLTATALVFEIIRRIFYYVFLGSFRPQK